MNLLCRSWKYCVCTCKLELHWIKDVFGSWEKQWKVNNIKKNNWFVEFDCFLCLLIWFCDFNAFDFVIWFNSWAYFLWYGYLFRCSGFIGFLTLCLVAEKIEEKRRKVKELNWGKNLTIWAVWYCDLCRMKRIEMWI